jgi:GntR family transcriptional regulator
MSTANIRIDSSSDVPIRRQLTEQIIFLIATGKLSENHQLPSVRELARRLKIHHNTVSDAYKDLTQRKWVEGTRGSRLTVISRHALPVPKNAHSLDDVINLTIQLAHAMGYSLQSLRQRVRERLMLEAPDHILVIDQDNGLREILCDELRQAISCPVKGCTQEELAANPGLAIGAMAVAPLYAIGKTDELFPKDRPVIAIAYSGAEEHIQRIRELKQPSTVAVVSASERFLQVARSILAPAIGTRHQLLEVLLPHENLKLAHSADVAFCDSIARRSLRSRKVTHYRLIETGSLESVISAMKSYAVSI